MITIIIPTTPHRRERLRELLSSIEENTQDIQYRVLIYENLDGGWVPAVYNALQGFNGIVWLLGSDTILKNNAVKILYEAYQKNFPNNEGVCEPYNELHNDTLCQHPFAHSDIIKKYLHKGYTHNFSDIEFTDRARLDNKLVYVPEAIIEHKHIVNGKAENDATYDIINNPLTMEKDQKLYEKRKSIDWATYNG